MSFDAHNHLDLCASALGLPASALIAAAAEAGVRGMVIAGVSPAAAAGQAAVCAGRPNLGWAFGLHPEQLAAWHAAGEHAAIEAALSSPAAATTGACAIGEVGLDVRFPESMGVQRRGLKAGLRLARATGLPIVLHVVGAHDAALDALGAGPWAGMVHSFSGTAADARRYLERGLHLSFGGPLTYGPSKKRRSALISTPIDRLLFETDAPDQAPKLGADRARPAIGRPDMLRGVAEAAAVLRGEPAAALFERAGENARRLFALADAPPRATAPPRG